MSEKVIDLKDISIEQIKDLTYTDISSAILEELKKVDFAKREERQEFFKYMSGFNSSSYSYRNRVLLYGQAKIKDLSNVFGTFKEWKEQEVNIKKGESSSFIMIPTKKTYYFTTDAEGNSIPLPFTKDPKELARRKQLLAAGEIEKIEKNYFMPSRCMFSIDQTDMQEQDRIAYLQRYNAYNTSEENKVILENFENSLKLLNVNLEYAETHAPLGWMTIYKNDMTIKKDMPVDATLSVMAHELGHHLMHKGVNNHLYNENQKEIQAQLFSQLVMEGLGIDSENDNSMSYIGGYLDNEAYKKKNWHKENFEVELLNDTLQIVLPFALKTIELVKEPTLEKVEELRRIKLPVNDNSAKKTKVKQVDLDAMSSNKVEFEDFGRALNKAPLHKQSNIEFEHKNKDYILYMKGTEDLFIGWEKENSRSGLLEDIVVFNYTDGASEDIQDISHIIKTDTSDKSIEQKIHNALGICEATKKQMVEDNVRSSAQNQNKGMVM